MDCARIGGLIKQLRCEKKLTQRAVAEQIGVSDKAVSKWERGMGCPDLSLLPALSNVFGVQIEGILSGELPENEPIGGNMKKVGFYRCGTCGNLITATGEAEITCCGRRLEPMHAISENEAHPISVQPVEDEWFVTIDHPMSKQHYITALIMVTADRMFITKLYPEQGAQTRFKQCGKCKIYACCSNDGLFQISI